MGSLKFYIYIDLLLFPLLKAILIDDPFKYYIIFGCLKSYVPVSPPGCMLRMGKKIILYNSRCIRANAD